MPTTPAAFNRLAMPHLDSVYRMARRLTGNDAEAEDLTQDTFLRAYRGFDRFELRKYGAKPWLLKILHNTFYTGLGKRARQPTLMEDVDFDDFAAELEQPSAGELGMADVNWESFDQELKTAIGRLSPEYREVLLLWALESLSYKQIAEVCGCAVGTVMSRLYRARHQVSRELAGYAKRKGLHPGEGRIRTPHESEGPKGS